LKKPGAGSRQSQASGGSAVRNGEAKKGIHVEVTDGRGRAAGYLQPGGLVGKKKHFFATIGEAKKASAQHAARHGQGVTWDGPPASERPRRRRDAQDSIRRLLR